MMLRRWHQAAVKRLFVLTLAVAVLSGAQPARGQEAARPETATHLVYLPYTSLGATIHGLVKLNGAPVAGVPLELRYYNGASWSTRATATTKSNGRYDLSAPSLLPGERYYVRYTNSTDSSRLSFWAPRI